MIEPVSGIRYKLACAYSEDSNQFAHWQSDHSLSMSEQTLDQSSIDCTDMLVDMSLRWVHMPTSWVKVFRIIPEFRILRLTFLRKSASKC